MTVRPRTLVIERRSGPLPAVDGDETFTVVAKCPALIGMPPGRTCLAALELPGEPITFTSDNLARVVRSGPTGLYVGGDGGRLSALVRP